MLPICKVVLNSLASVIVLWGTQSVVAQQWPVGQVPVENAVPQYRPRSVQPSLPSSTQNNQAGTLPLNFFNENLGAGGAEPKPSAVPEPNSLSPAVSRSPSSNQELLVENPLRAQGAKQAVVKPPTPTSQAVKPKTAKPKVDQAAKAKQLAAKKKAAAKKVAKKKKEKAKPQPVLNNEIYRDQAVFPIDPRKPNWPCGGGQCRKPGCKCQSGLKLGNQGRPYHERELGGCECDTRKPNKHPNFSVHWPRPFSAKLDASHPEAASARYSGCQEKRLVDVFDGLASFKLIEYKRTDNGYSGPGADRYGCLGESQMR